MAGLGKYKKGAKFTLKSGNKPAFKAMGSSPANMNNFGIGQGGSPWKQETSETPTETPTETPEEKKARLEKEKANSTVDEQGGEAEKADKAWVKALKAGTTLLSGGIQGVYGGKREYPKINYGKKAEKVTKSPEDNVNDLIAGKQHSGGFGALSDSYNINNTNSIDKGEEKSETTYEIQSGDNLSKIAEANNTTVEELMKKNPQITNKNMIKSGESINL
jgi:LysM repeat protein